MPSLKFIRKRISSVKNTQKITKAMKMVSAAKLRRAQDRAQNSKPYEEELQRILNALVEKVENLESPLLETRKLQKRAIVVISTDRGLCGSLNANVFKKVMHYVQEQNDLPYELITYGKKAKEFFSKREFPIFESKVDITKNANFELIEGLSKDLQKYFIDGTFDEVQVFYPEFHSALVQKPIRQQFLPFEVRSSDKNQGMGRDFIYEPDAKTLAELLLPQLINFRLYRMMIESFASEHAARMAAMDSASKNARDMIGRLTLEMNRARQAAITKELMEIIGGAEAISK